MHIYIYISVYARAVMNIMGGGRTSIYSGKSTSTMMPESSHGADIQASNLSQMP